MRADVPSRWHRLAPAPSRFICGDPRSPADLLSRAKRDVAGHGVDRSDCGSTAVARRESAPRVRAWRAAAERKSIISAVRAPCTRRLARTRARPSAVRAPVLLPPCRRQRPLAMAGWRQAQPARVCAPQRGAARKSPEEVPWRSLPRLRADKRFGSSGSSAEGFGGQARLAWAAGGGLCGPLGAAVPLGLAAPLAWPRAVP